MLAVACAQPVSEAPEFTPTTGGVDATTTGDAGGGPGSSTSDTVGSALSASSATASTAASSDTSGSTTDGGMTGTGGAATETSSTTSNTSDTESASTATASSVGGATSGGSTTTSDDDVTASTSTTGNSTTGNSTTGNSTTGNSTTGGSNGCVAAPGELISDFSDWSGTSNGTWSGDGGLSGDWFTYAGSGSSITVTHTSGTLRLTGTVNNYAGFGMSLETCTDASAYDGVSFEVSGSIGGTGEAVLQVQTNSNLEQNGGRGECTTDCTNNQYVYSVPSSAATRTVGWNQLSGGSPVSPADPEELMGFQWQFHCVTDGACALNVTLDDVSFAE